MAFGLGLLIRLAYIPTWGRVFKEFFSTIMGLVNGNQRGNVFCVVQAFQSWRPSIFRSWLLNCQLRAFWSMSTLFTEMHRTWGSGAAVSAWSSAHIWRHTSVCKFFDAAICSVLYRVFNSFVDNSVFASPNYPSHILGILLKPDRSIIWWF